MLPEGRYDLVDPPGAERAVLVLHPHPEYGGDRRNPVVDAVFRRWEARCSLFDPASELSRIRRGELALPDAGEEVRRCPTPAGCPMTGPRMTRSA